MSSVDNRVVSLEFDNKQFQNEIRKTAESLRGFDAELNSVGSRSALDGIETLSNRFTTLKTIGMMTFADLTSSAIKFGTSILKNVIGITQSKGMSRAMNIEQAKFMIAGMGQNVEAVMQSANDAVSGTAYGLDAAASAAAKFGAAGLKAGDELTSALRGVAGVAAMTGNSYESISEVFTDAAALGKASGMILSRLEQRGLGVTQILADSLGTTTEGVKQMARDGEISFKQFAAIMNDAFGAHAQRANETYAGSLSNIQSAFGRIGAEFQAYRMEGMRVMFNALIPAINGVKAALDPVFKMFGLITLISAQKFEGFIKSFIGAGKDGKASEEFVEKLKTGFQNLSEAMGSVARSVSRVFEKLTWHFRNVFKSDPAGYFIKITEAIKKFATQMEISDTVANNIGKIFAALVSIFRLAINVVGGLAQVIGALFGGVSDGAGGLLHVIGRMAEFVTWMVWATIESGKLKTLFDGLAKAAGVLGKVLGFVIGVLASILKYGLLGIFFGLKNVLTLIAIPLKAVGSAINTIFRSGGPAAEAARKAFQQVKDAISSIIPSGEAAGKTMDRLKEIFGTLGDWIVSKLPSEETIANAFGSIGDFFSDLVLKIGSILPTMDQVQKALSSTGDFFKALWNALSPITNVFKSIFGAIGFLAGIVQNTLLSTTVPLEEVGGTFEKSGDSLEKLKKFLQGLVTAFKVVGEALWNAVSWIGEQISKYLGFENVKSAAKFLERNLSKILLGGVLVVMNKFASAIKNFSSGESDPFGLGKFTKGLTEFKHGYEKSKIEKIAASLLKVSISIGIFAASMWLLSKIDLGGAAKGLGQIALFLGSVAAMMIAISKNTGSGLKFNAIGLSFIQIAAAMLILAAAMKLFSMMDQDAINQGGGAIISLLAVFGTAFTLMGKFGEGLKGILAASAGMILMAIAMTMMVAPIKLLGEMDIKTLRQGMITLGILLVTMGAVMTAMGMASTKGIDAGLGLILFAHGINKLIDVMVRLSDIKLDVLFKGGGALVVILAGVVGLFHLLPSEGDFVKLGAGMILMSVGMMVISMAIEKMGQISLAGIIVSTLALIALINAFVIAADEIGDKTMQIAGIIGLSAAIMMIAYALAGLSDMGIAGLIVSTLAIVGLIAALAIAANSLQASGAGVAGMIGLAAALMMMASALQVLGNMGIAQLVTSVLALAAVILILVGVGAALAAFAPVTLVAAAALIIFGAAVIVFAAGAFLLARAFEIIANNAEAGGNALIRILSTVILFMPRLIAAVGQGLVQLAQQFLLALPALIEAFGGVIEALITLGIELVPRIVELGVTIITALLEGFIQVIPVVVEAIMVLIGTILEALAEHIEEFTIMGAEILVGFLNGLAGMMPQIVEAGANLIVQFLNGLAANIGQIVSAGVNLLVQLLNGIGAAIGQIAGTITDVIIMLLLQLASHFEELLDAGTAMLIQILNGLLDFTTEAVTLVVDFVVALLGHIADEVLRATEEILQIAINFLNGLADIMDDEGQQLITAAGRVVRAFMRLLLHGFTGIKNLFGDVAGAIIDGIGGAIKDAPGALLDLGADIAGGLFRGFTGFLGISSPSKLFYDTAKYIPMGIANALGEDESASLAASSLADNTIDAFRRSINNINYVINTMDEFDPVIAPVLDLTSVEQEAQRISDILGGHEFDANLSKINAGAISAMSRFQPEEADQAPQQVIQDITFEQTINAPDPLSTMDIYNATRSQIQIAKDELSLV